MSLSKDALDTITATAIAASGAPLDTHVPAILIPDGYALKNLEHLQARPSRFRGTFRTHHMDAFAEYVKQHARPNESAGFIGDDMAAQAIFDLGNHPFPGHGNHTAYLELFPTAPFRAAQDINGKTLSQQALIEWLEDWAPCIHTVGAGAESIPLEAAIDAVRRMRLETKGARETEIGDFNAKRSAMEEIEAKSAGRLPVYVQFTCVPYECLNDAVIHFRLSVLTGEDVPRFRLRWVNQGPQTDHILHQFRDRLTEQLQDVLPITLGTFTK